MTQDQSAAAFFARVSQDLMREQEEAPTLQRVAERAVEIVGPVDHCGISLRRRRRRVETVASTSDLARQCDLLQYELGEGPCLEAVWDESSYLCPDTRTDRRWPRWGPRVAEAGIGSVLAIRLSTDKESLGALNLYAVEAGAFTQDDVDLALIYAAHATNAMSTARLVTGLTTAVQSRHLIGVAQGILMNHYGLGMQDAFEVLRRYSSQANVKLRDIAQVVVDAGGLPDMHDVAHLRTEASTPEDAGSPGETESPTGTEPG